MTDALESTERAYFELEGGPGNAQLVWLFGGVLGILV